MNNNDSKKTVIETGISAGSALAMIISWSVYHSILMAIFHGFLGWFYVIYYAVTQ